MLLPTVPRLTDATRAELEKIAARPSNQQRLAQRARLVLALDEADGAVRAVAKAFAVTAATVRKWARRVAEHGIAGLRDRDRSGRPCCYQDEVVRDLLTLATSTPPKPYARWSHARLAQAMGELNWGVSASWVTRTLSRLRMKVHRVIGWLGRRGDPDFDLKVAAVQAAITSAGNGEDPHPVLSLDEKTAYSVRTPVRADTHGSDGTIYREFEYRRRGTISWYGVQEVAGGELAMVPAAERMDSASFCHLLDRLLLEHGEIFTLIMDNGPAHTSRATRAWLAQHPGITILHTPAHASWVNPIESVFGILARQVLRHGYFTGPADCNAHVQAWVADRNRQRRPVRFAWQPDRGSRTCAPNH